MPRPSLLCKCARVRFKHSWGTAEKLYKSEAIDSFGNKYLLGVYETVKEAEKAFDEWNKERPGRKYPSFPCPAHSSVKTSAV